MNLRTFTIAIATSCTLIGCGENKLDMRMGSDSVEQVMQGMSTEEKVSFIKDMEILISLKGKGSPDDPYVLNGYTANMVREEAEVAKRLVRERNIALLNEIISEMESKGRNTISLNKNSAGLFMRYREGYLPKTYTIEQLKAYVSEQGGMNAEMNKAKDTTANTTTKTAQPEFESKQDAAVIASQQSSRSLMGDKLDDDENATPNSKEDAENRASKKQWQDNNGRIHYPDGSISNGPVD